MPQKAQQISRKKQSAHSAQRPRQTTAQQITPNKLPDPHQPLTPDNVLQLQRTLGNKATAQIVQQRQQPGIMQRFTVNEKNLDFGVLQSLQIAGAGTGGVTLIVQSTKGQMILKKVKAGSNTLQTILGSKMHELAGSNTPAIRMASGEEKDELDKQIQGLLGSDYDDAAQRYLGHPGTDVLLMDFATGSTLPREDNQAKSSKMKNEGKPMTPEEEARMVQANEKRKDVIREAIDEPQFQQELGRILATDAFYGENDRMHLYDIGSDEVEFYYNPGNLIVMKDETGHHAIPIDNEFNPEDKGHPFAGARIGSSLAALDVANFTKEAEHIYDAFINIQKPPKIVLFGLKKQARQTQQLYKWLLWKNKRGNFVKTVVQSAQDTLDQLFKHGQNWKEHLTEAGANENLTKEFRLRVRGMRLIRDGMDRNRALRLAKDQAKYRQWVLTKEFGFKNDTAQKILDMGDAVYKYVIRNNFRGGRIDYILLHILTKEAGLSIEQAEEIIKMGPKYIKGYIEDAIGRKKIEPELIELL